MAQCTTYVTGQDGSRTRPAWSLNSRVLATRHEKGTPEMKMASLFTSDGWSAELENLTRLLGGARTEGVGEGTRWMGMSVF
jgi:hypothetical protein